MTIKLPKLPYAMDALEPHISTETMEYHFPWRMPSCRKGPGRSSPH